MPITQSLGDPYKAVRQYCLSLPETSERLSHGHPTFFVQGKKGYVNYMNNHHHDGRIALWCAAPWGMQQALVQNNSIGFFVPPYVGHRGWVGVWLDVGLDTNEVHGIILEAYRQVAPTRLLRLLEP